MLLTCVNHDNNLFVSPGLVIVLATETAELALVVLALEPSFSMGGMLRDRRIRILSFFSR